jgi:hypothetical protein
MNTRGLTGMVSQRIADTSVDVAYNILTEQDDGSSFVLLDIDHLKGSILALQPKEIQRLQEGGIEVKNGISLLLSEAREDRPDKIQIDDKTWRVVNWSFSFEYVKILGSGFINRGTVVAVCDLITVGNAV